MTQKVGFRLVKQFLPILLAGLCAVTSPAVAQPQTCAAQGDASSQDDKDLNVLKNRETAPAVDKINSNATLEHLLAPEADLTRWSDQDGAILEGIVVHVKRGGKETANCHAKDARHQDTHIELALSPSASATKRVIVEVTPRWRALMEAQGTDWTTAALCKKLIGRRVRVTGWLFDDRFHTTQAKNTNPRGSANWRATIWEIHPITNLEVLPGVAYASRRCRVIVPAQLLSTNRAATARGKAK